MNITDIRTRMYSFPFRAPVGDAYRTMSAREILTVEVLTNEGLTGFSFLTGFRLPETARPGQEVAVLKTAIDRVLRDSYVGQNPLDREKLWSNAYRRTLRYGRKGVAIVALGGIDIALWDLMGKVTNQPVAKLLGGYKDSVPAYVSGGLITQDVSATINEVNGYAERGFELIKVKVGSPNVKDDVERLEAIHEALGNKVRLLVDANEAWNLAQAMSFTQRVQEQDLFWLEEPLPLQDVEGYRRLAYSTHIPIAVGDYESGKFAFKEFMRDGLINYLHADATRVGGITEWIKLAHAAETWGVLCSAHAVTEIHVHTVSAIPNGSVVEYYDDDHPIQWAVGKMFPQLEELRSVRGGLINVPERPGLGLELDLDFASRYEID